MGPAPLRARTLAAVIAAALVIACPRSRPRPARADAHPQELKEAKKELRATKERIRAGNHKLRRLQRR